MIKRIIQVFLSRGLAAAGTVLLTIAVPVLYNINVTATFFTGFALLYILSIVARCGFDVYLLRESAAHFGAEKKTVELAHILLFFLCVLFAGLITTVWLLLRIFYPSIDEYAWVMWALPAFSGLGLISFYLRGSGNEIWAALTEPGSLSFLTVIVLYYIHKIKYGYLEPSFAFVVIAWLVFLFNALLFFLRYRVARSHSSSFVSVFAVSYLYLVNQLSSYVSQWFPVFVFNYLDKDLVVYFTVANRLATIVTFFGATIDSFSAPRFSGYWKSGDLMSLALFKEKMRKLALLVSVGAFLIVLVASIGYGIFSGLGQPFFFLVTILLLGYSASIGMGPNGYLLIMTEYNSYATRVTVVGCLSIIISSAVLSCFKQGVAAVIAVSLITALRAYFFRRKVDVLMGSRL